MSSLFEQAITDALNSANPQKVLEGQVANAIIQAEFNLVSFNKVVGLNGEIGEIDVETSNAIIEVTTQTARKLKQIQKLISNPDLNPLKKPVILYAPNYKITPAQDIIATGSYVVRAKDELLELLFQLGA
ncbi:hypothetical protein VF14_26985 [Nostoc linckia z18]|uniref:Uncharacterized protein n=2 Tax=Nostoc linckia TaxID=92942 RepID=A0A9Q6EJN3_NOSLI|nr:hypothetical protein [Nostoc linckia]PHK38775.1 hypothetical protein VF12_16745 [Nostoc linckia z15]PHK44293.1 hypothetical protein VF13_22425 [Nostoc linckia z16]PHJ62773.1 hypothetical protein VF02_16605 [Nostoc linckia z1]PHJ66602.1 hypothetical protein VF05_18880 [Nostoc linckia z3]PHJ72723.1 hypothetical protein VF03_17980 [Nostoc linckia z2]